MATGALAPAAEPSRLERWKRRLLDLSRRNPLLNLRQGRRAIPIDCPDLAALEDALAGGEAFAIQPRPAVMAETDPRERDAHHDRTGQDAVEAFLQAQMARHRLHTPLAPEDFDRRLLEVSRADRLSLEESGAHTLFMALGFLRWYESERSPDANLAPIILIPMAIERGSVRDGFRVRMLDDEPRINITLVEKLKAGVGVSIDGLDPLPMDDAGLDVPAILRRCREAVKTIDRWQVEETCTLAILTFTKFVMWLDLERHHDRLRESPIVRHLLETPGETFPAAPAAVDTDALDQQLRPAETFCPLDADASQLAAVVVADQGHSFVLQGPPGTGKSQTIANLMAHAMTRGRRVLFVSEKMAALEVVRRRLEGLGLGPFCLELHSRKATRTDVRRQLEEALQVERHLEPPEWPHQTNRLEIQRAALNACVEALHQPRPFGQTAWWAINRMIDHADLTDLAADLGPLAAMTPERADAIMLAAQQAQTAATAVDLHPDHPLRDVGRCTWELGLEERLSQALDRLDPTAEALAAAADAALSGLQIACSQRPWAALVFAEALADCLRRAPPLATAMVEAADWPATRDGLRDLVARGRERDERRQRLKALYTDGVLALPLEALRQRLAMAPSRGTLRRWWGTARVRARLKAFSTQPKALTATAMADHLDNAIALNRLEVEVAVADDLTRLFGPYWRQGRPDWDLLQSQVDWVERFRTACARDACMEPSAATSARSLWTALVAEQPERLAPSAPLGVALTAFLEAMKAFRQAWSTAGHEIGLDDSAGGPLGAPDCLAAVRAAAARWRSGLRGLRSWCAWKAARRRAAEAGMERVLQAVEAGTAPVDRLAALAEKTFARWCLKEILAQDPVLGDFHGPEHNRRIEAFRDLDEQVRRLTAATVFAQLSQRLPHQGADIERFRSSQMGALKRIAKGARFTIRQVFADCPDALARLKPCVFMSPLSVAQFLGTDFPKFDLVVFDEASQMPPWEAIGAIARGQQVVVVGDSKQLPPTSFFEKTATEGDDEAPDEEDVEDLESILDECVACQMPTRSLTWHYRSRHETLIAFSNRHYYVNALSTFPSSVDDPDRLGLSLRQITDGFYDAGRSRTNRPEAEALVADVVRRLTDPAERRRSIGVVTFSLAQQGLVEDLLEQARRDHPDIEAAFTDQIPEPVFVKNLETVQGDERDVILFSIAYGPNRQGLVSMNFGPLNRKGGERRLNVAITRARQQLVVFATLRPDQIDLERTTAVGVRHLQAFLAFAAEGARTPSTATPSTGRHTALPPIEQSIREALELRGWEVRSQVGCSDYRVDLAVVHPDRPGAFLLGIECDGATYRSARTARDRDRIRQAVLRGLGWRLTRVWALDWWLEREGETARLQHDLEQALEASRHNAAGAPPEPDTTPPSAPRTATPAGLDPPAAPRETIVDENRDGRPDPPGQRLYRRAPARRRGVAAALAGPGNDHLIRDACAEVLAAEAPIDTDLLARRVAADWGVTRLSAGLRRRILETLPAGTRLTQTPSGRAFLWNTDQDPERYEGFRMNDPAKGPLRDIDQICPQEIANLMEALLHDHIGIHRDELVRAAAAALGQARLGQRLRESLEEGLALLEQRQRKS